VAGEQIADFVGNLTYGTAKSDLHQHRSEAGLPKMRIPLSIVARFRKCVRFKQESSTAKALGLPASHRKSNRQAE
jgi:hypothetical protein